jgi:hypothetical protein
MLVAEAMRPVYACCISPCHLQIGVLRMHLSGGQEGGSQSVVTWYGRGDGDLIHFPVWLIPLNLLF